MDFILSFFPFGTPTWAQLVYLSQLSQMSSFVENWQGIQTLLQGFSIRLLTPVVTERCNIFAHFSGLWDCWINSFLLSSCVFLPASIKICFTHTAQLLPSQFTSSLVFFWFNYFLSSSVIAASFLCLSFFFHSALLMGCFSGVLSILNYPKDYLSTNVKLYPPFI